MQETFRGTTVPVTAVGFSPPAALALLAETLQWEGPFLSDEDRVLYRRLRLPRARLSRVYSVRTLTRYARAAAGGRRLPRPVEDTRQLGGDALLVDGTARLLWRPRTPDDRVGADVLAAAAGTLSPDGS